jgi:hypothetical protein
VLDYDAEAARYDDTRGGEPRAAAAARALPDPDTARPDPVYRLLALRRTLSTAVARRPVPTPS